MSPLTPTFEKKFFLQILSLAAAIVLWFAITYSEDPVIKISINNIQLKTIGENSLINNELIFVNKNNLPNISIEVRGKRSDVTNILNSVTAVVDISDITEEGEYTKELTFDIPNNSVTLVKKRISSITIKVEKSVSKTIPVYVMQTNAAENKNMLVKSTPALTQITISGTTDDISKTKEALISVDIGNITADNHKKYPVNLADSNHTVLTPENPMHMSSTEISVNNKCYMKKTLNIALNTQLDFSGYQILVKSFSPETVEVGIESDDFDTINTIYADFESGIALSTDGKYKMKLIIPENVYCPAPPKELTMTADIEGISTETISVPIASENLADGLSATLSQDSVSVEMTGAKSKMAEVKAKVDLSGLIAGTYNLPVKFTTDNTGISIEREYFIDVTIQ